MASDHAEITIINWKKFNGRPDVKHPSWFRVDYRLLEDSDFYDFSFEEFKAWLYFMAQACKKNDGKIRVSYAHAKATARLSRKGIDGALRKLNNLGIADADVTHPLRERNANDTRQDRTGQTGQDKTEQTPVFDFESLYKKYPRKIAKTEALARLERLLGTQGDFDACAKAIDRFCEYVREKGTEEKYIPHMATFLGVEGKECWRDWLDPETGTSDAPKGGGVDYDRLGRELGIGGAA